MGALKNKTDTVTNECGWEWTEKKTARNLLKSKVKTINCDIKRLKIQ